MTLDKLFYPLDIFGVLEKMPKKVDLIRLLSPISYQWIVIGESLRIPYGDLKQLTYSHLPDVHKLSETLQIWIDTKCRPVTWQTIIDVVSNPPVENMVLADEIRHFLSETELTIH